MGKVNLNNITYRFDVSLQGHLVSEEIQVSAKIIGKNEDGYDTDVFGKDADKVIKAYFTPERLKEIKRRIIEKIETSDDWFYTANTEIERCDVADEDELFDI